jgi:glycosyltransferase involved in cell wall biosynthesis
MFSIVIPLYNKEQSIVNTIKSVLNQSYQDFEIVVVNDGSTDNSLKLVEQINDSRIRIINKPNRGVSSARNRGIKEAKSELIALLDGDDLWEHNYLEEMNSLIIDFPDRAIWGCNYDIIDNGKHVERIVNLPILFKGELNDYFDGSKNYPLFWTSSVILKKSKTIEIGGFDERITIGEDLDLWFRMILNYPPPIFYNKVLAHYNMIDPNSAMKKKHDFSKSIMYYKDKYCTWEKTNRVFAKYINMFYCQKYIDLFTNYNTNKNIVKKYTQKIDTSVTPLKWKIYCRLPYSLKKIIAELMYYKTHKL